MNIPTAAHKTLPLPCLVEVTNLANGRKIVVRVNDRGPFYGDRLIDMSKEAAIELGFYGHGTAQVRVRYVGQAPDAPGGATLYQVEDGGPPSRTRAAPSVREQQPPRQTPVQVASAGSAVLGAQIDSNPLQSSPSTVSWNTASPPRLASPPPAAPQPAPLQPPPSEAPLANAPAPGSSSSDIDSLLDQLASTPISPAPPASSSMVQAGAFASRANAERAAAALNGQTQIVPVEQSGRTLYKVMQLQ
jgi:rare lipoprotein A